MLLNVPPQFIFLGDLAIVGRVHNPECGEPQGRLEWRRVNVRGLEEGAGGLARPKGVGEVMDGAESPCTK